MDQQALEALLASIAPGGVGSNLKHIETREKVTVMETPPGGLEPVKVEKEVPIHIWYDPATGQAIKARINADGTYEKTFQGIDKGLLDTKPSASTAAAAEPPKTEDRGGRHYVWKPNPGGSDKGGQWVDSGPASLTAAEQAAAAPPKEEVNPSDPTRLRKPDGKGGWTDAGPNAAGVQAAADRNKPSVHLSADGSQATLVYPDGRVETKPTGVTGKPTTVTLEGRLYERDPDGNYVDKTPQKPQIPSNIPPFAPDWAKPGLGIVEYAAAIRARPDLTDDQKTEVIKTAHENATATVSQANTIASSQADEATRQTTERGQNTAQANQRLSSSSTNFGNALTAANEATKYSVGPDAGAVLPYYLAQAAGQAQAYGGFNTPPAVQPGPAVRQIGMMGIPGQGVPSVRELTGASIMGNGPWGSGGTTPNTNSAGAPASLQAPDAAAVEAANQAAQAGFHAAAGPLLAPPPVAAAPAAVAAPALAAPVAAPAGMPPLPATPAADPVLNFKHRGTGQIRQMTVSQYNALPDRDQWDAIDPNKGQWVDPGPSGDAAPAPPGAPQPGMLPQPQSGAASPQIDPSVPYPATYNPESQAAPAGTNMAAMMGAGPWQQPAQQGTTGMAPMVAMAGQRAMTGYDPTSVNQQLLAAGIDPQIVQLFGGAPGAG